ncbi:MAG: beta-N-acetylhexosaminidase [Lachnospiraceae bacterium]|nr:beta-N-acetylhexosaminidase [Lachnospiraceae bacterium]
MGKLFHKRKGYSDEEYDEEYEDETLEDDEDEDIEDDDEIEEDEDEDIDEDEEDEDDGDEEDIDDDEEIEEDEDDRRAYRRRRRIRNQIISYSVVLIFLAAFVAGGVVVGMKISSRIQDKKQAEALAQQQAEEEAQAAQEMVIDTPETITEGTEEEEDYLGEVVEAYISEMPIEDKVAGLFVVTPEAITGVSTAIQAGNGTQEALNQYAVGGLIYFDKNISDKEQIMEMLSNTASMSKYPIFLAVDEEGGSVSRVANSDIEVIQVDDMAMIGAGGDTAQAYESGVTIGAYLKEIGFNVDFAPVADVVPEGGSSVLEDRAFGSDAQTVGGMVANMVEGIEGTGVSSCLKHFPGIGSASEDTHDGRVEITKTLEEMRGTDFVPFQAGIEAGADFVMVSHITASALDEDGVPSSLSEKVMTDILRGELGFEGVIITDALDMTAITDYYTSEEAAVKAIEAGADMLLMPEDFNEAYDALLAAVQDGTISEERIDESLRRIYRIKCAEKLE